MTMKNQYYRMPAHLAQAKLDLYTHLMVYVLVNLMLFSVNEIVAPSTLWYLFPLVGWGVCLAVHGLILFILVGSHLKARLTAVELKPMHRA